MVYISNTLDFCVEEPSAITFGKFDGLHRGHGLLMEHLKENARLRSLKTIVFTFNIPPRDKVEQAENKVLTTNEEKKLIFEAEGVDYLIECPFTAEVMCMPPEDFIRWIVEKLNVKCIVAGTDFHFGYKRGGDYRLLKACEETYGYRTEILNKVQEDCRDISSTFVREEIAKGNIEKANHLLGYEYFISGRIVHGRQLGRKIGIPTINLIPEPNKLLPPFGVYVSRVNVGDRWYEGVSNIGRKPTIIGGDPVGVETYIIDFCQDVYGRAVTVEFLHFLRPEMKFGSIEELRQQMSADIARTANYFKNSIYNA